MLALLNPTVLLTLLASTLASAGAAFFFGMSVQKDRSVAQEARDKQVAEIASKAAASAINKIEVRHVTVQNKVEREIVEKPVFRDCKSGPDLVRDFNSTIAGPDGAADRELPAADAAH